MSKNSAGHSNLFANVAKRLRQTGPFLFIPVALVTVASFVAFRHTAIMVPMNVTIADSLQLPLGWTMPPTPADNPITSAKFILGRQLFYEVALSGDGRVSCGSCHHQGLSFSDTVSGPQGAFGIKGTPRHSPRLVNVAYDTVLFWDGHAHSLEEQARMALLKVGDLQADTNAAMINLSKNPGYTSLFANAFGDPTINVDRITKAIATFVRCLVSGNSSYDQYVNGNTAALSASAIRGMSIFFDTTKHCSQCHGGDSVRLGAARNIFTNNSYYATGFAKGYYGFGAPDSGREDVTFDANDVGKFRTPQLRNVGVYGPYGADGSVGSLKTVIQNYNTGGSSVTNKDSRIKALNLSSQDQSDLVAFLNSLTDTSFLNNKAFANPGPLSGVEDGYFVSEDLSIYPNPASNNVTIECPDLNGPTEARLISSNGMTVWSRNINADGRHFQFDFAGIPNGVYRLELTTGTSQHAANIILKR